MALASFLSFLLVLLLASQPGSCARRYARPSNRPLLPLDHRRSDQPSGPEQVHITLKGPDHVLVTWLTPRKTAAKSVVFYGTSSGNYSEKTEGFTERYSYLTYKSGNIHHAAIGPLAPSTQYFYRVGDPEKALSREFSFRTVPSVGPTEPVSFTIIGDLGQTRDSESTLKHVEGETSDVVILAGDLSYADRYQPRWDTWGRLVEPTLSKFPFMSVEGNHEIETIGPLVTPFTAYNARYPMPYQESKSSSNLYYSFEVGSVHALMLGAYTNFDSASDQYRWLEADLADVDRQRTPWVVAVWHAPWYNSNYAHQGEGEAMRKAMEALLYAARVDVTFSGHVHAYERTARVYNFKKDPCGPVHIVVGDGGNREGLASRYMDPQPDWSMVREASFGHGVLEFFNSTHARWQWHRNQDDVPVRADEVLFENLVQTDKSTCQPSSRAIAWTVSMLLQ